MLLRFITKLFKTNYRFFFKEISKSSNPNYSIFILNSNRNSLSHSIIKRPKIKVNIWLLRFIILIKTKNKFLDLLI